LDVPVAAMIHLPWTNLQLIRREFRLNCGFELWVIGGSHDGKK
jgi:hypothetical protein